MFPILYKKDETNFIHNGLGVLSGAISAVPEEELNGPFEIKIEYDSKGFLADKIENGMIVKAKANDRQDPQLFRIYAIEKSLTSDNLIIHGQHITYDLAGNFVEQLALNDVTTKEAMEALQAKLAYPTRFNITSTNNTTRSSTSLYRTNPLQMVAGMDGSILDNWGGEIERDNFNLIMHQRRGSDNGVLVTYKKNLTGLEAKFDESQVVTRIFPFKYIEAKDDEPEQLITIDGKYIDSPNINKYPVIKILPLDFSNDENIKNKSDLYNASKDYFKTGGKDLPTVEMEVEFEPLHGTEEYKDVAALELVGMGDTITVRHSKMGVDVKAKVVKIEYDSIAEKNKKVSVGNVKARLTDTVNNASNIANTIDEKIQNANQKANEAIRAANGKNTIFYGPDEPVNPQKDDLWFKTVDGEYTRTYRFDGIQWQLVVSVDVKDAMDNAQEARNRADEAAAKADLATQNANEAIADAQAAFDEAQSAHNVAEAAREASDIAGRVAGEAKEQVGTAIADARQAMTDARSALTGITDLRSNVDVEFENINGQLSNKVSQKEFDGLKGIVTNHSTLIQQTQTDIKSKADKTYVDTVKGTVDSHSTLIQQNAKEIQSKASQSSVNTLTGRVSTAESRITQNAKEIASKISTTDANAKFATQSQLTQKSDSLTSQITQVQTNLDNLEIGGRNYIRNSNFASDFEGWQMAPLVARDFFKIVAPEADKPNSKIVTISRSGESSVNIFSLYSNFFPVSLGEEITYSFDFKIKNWAEYDRKIPFIAEFMDADGRRVQFRDVDISEMSGADMPLENNKWYRLFYTIKAARPTITQARLRVALFQNGEVFYRDFKAEKGNKATDWSPAPEDLTTNVQFSKLEQTVDSISTQVTEKVDKTIYDSFVQQTAQSLASKISSVDADKKYATQSRLTQTAQGLQTQVNNNKGNISIVTQLANTLQSRMSNAEGNISTLTQTANSLTSQITSVRNDLDGLEIGGRNLARNTKTKNFVSYQNGAIQIIDDGYIRVTNSAGVNAYFGLMQTTTERKMEIVEGEKYTISFDVRGTVSSMNYVYVMRPDAVTNQSFSAMRVPSSTEFTRVSSTHTANSSSNNAYLMIATRDEPNGAWFEVKNIKLEKGNKATDWTPAPEDMATQSQISQLSDAINLRVTKKDLINQINIDTSGILIQGKKLILDGNVNVTGTFKVSNANIVSVDAGKMTTGTLDAGKVSVININASNIKTGSLNANTVTVASSNGVQSVRLDNTGLRSIDSNGKLRIHLGVRNIGGAGQSDPATMRFFSGNGSVSASIGMNVNDHFIIGSQAASVSTSIYSGKNQLYWANEHRMAFNDWSAYWRIIKVIGGSSTENPGLVPHQSGRGYIGLSYNRLWAIFTNELHYMDLKPLSTRERKTNIKDADSAYLQSVFDDIDLVTFNYLNDDGGIQDDLSLGLIAEDSPDLITTKDKKSLRLNNMIGVIGGSLKHQTSRIDQLEKLNEELVLKVAKLEEKIHELEAS